MSTLGPPEGWTLDTGVWGVDADQDTIRYSGSYSLKLKNTSVATKLLTDYYPVRNSRMLHATAVVRADSNAAGKNLTITLSQFSDYGSGAGPLDYILNTHVVATSTWEEYGVYVWAASSTNFVQATVAKAAQAFNAWIDHVIVTPAPAFFSASRHNNQSINNATWTKVAFDTEQSDLGSLHDGAGIFTAPYHSLWQFSAGVSFDSLADQKVAQIGMQKNGTFINEHDLTLSGTYAPTLSISSGPMELVTGDQIKVMAYQNSGGALNVIGDDRLSFFRGSEVGAT